MSTTDLVGNILFSADSNSLDLGPKLNNTVSNKRTEIKMGYTFLPLPE